MHLLKEAVSAGLVWVRAMIWLLWGHGGRGGKTRFLGGQPVEFPPVLLGLR